MVVLSSEYSVVAIATVYLDIMTQTQAHQSAISAVINVQLAQHLLEIVAHARELYLRVEQHLAVSVMQNTMMMEFLQTVLHVSTRVRLVQLVHRV